jgi:hypothetical protein
MNRELMTELNRGTLTEGSRRSRAPRHARPPLSYVAQGFQRLQPAITRATTREPPRWPSQ